MKKSLVVFFLLIISTLSLYSQKRTFRDTLTFVEDLKLYMKIAMSDKEIVAELDTFSLYWSRNKIGEMYKLGIVLVSDAMVRRYAKPQTHFFYYLKTINGFVRKNRLKDYQEWEFGLLELVDIQNEMMTKVEAYLLFSSNLINYNILIETSTLAWKSSKSDFEMFNDVKTQTLTVKMEDFNLTCYSKSDSFTISNTKGVLYPVEKKFVGENGMITWERTGLSKDSVYALLQIYEIEMSAGYLKAEKAALTHKKYLGSKSYLGIVEDKLMGASLLKTPTYPKFTSYDDNVLIKNIMPNANYRGCFNMEGNKFVGKGTEDGYANLDIIVDGQNFISVASKSFNFFKDKRVTRKKDTIFYEKVSAAEAMSVIRLSKKDSIYHYGISFEYNDTSQIYSFSRFSEDETESPFIDTYHQLSIYAGEIRWKYGDIVLYVYTTPRAAMKTAVFESNEYFSMKKYNLLKGYDETNPLVVIKNFWKTDSLNNTIFETKELQKYINSNGRYLQEDMIHMQLYKLAKEGFVLYDPKTRVAVIQSKLFRYISNRTKTDYDGIFISSKLDGYYGVNGIINLKTLRLDVIKPEPTVLSNSKQVGFLADTVTIFKNKDMKFNGVVNAGLLEISGKSFEFNYNNFMIDLEKIDSVTIVAKDSTGKYLKVASKMEKTSGYLEIDAKKNKSGRDTTLKGYPTFHTTDTAFVFYDYTDAEKYPRDKFFFKVDPFTIKEAGDIRKDSLRSAGTFVSGIFPDLSVTMTIQFDNSLGFDDPFEKLPIYDGVYTGNVSMNNKNGLTGKGTITYLTTTAMSEFFRFSPAKVESEITTVTVDALTKDKIPTIEHAKSDFAQANTTKAKFDWIQKDSLIEIFNEKEGIEMYDKFSNLMGQINISKYGITGQGRFRIKDIVNTTDVKSTDIKADAFLVARNFDFNVQSLSVDTTNFYIEAEEESARQFQAFAYQSFIDVAKQTSYFTTNYDTAEVRLDINQYNCQIDHYVFDMQLDSIYMGSGIKEYDDQKYFTTNTIARDAMRNSLSKAAEKKKVRMTGSWFTSTNPEQENLNFYSEISTFDLRLNKIIAKKVELIEVADANIYPQGEYINIYRNARMDKLNAAEIIAPRDSQYHVIKYATANIYGKNSYTGTGEYTYSYNSQKFYFTDIKVDANKQTIASTKILVKDSLPLAFMLSPDFAFNGDINLFARNEYLKFDGYTFILNTCDQIKNEYFKFTNFINQDSVYIPLDSASLTLNKRNVYAGLMINNPSLKNQAYEPFIYSAFTSPMQNVVAHKPIITAEGDLYYDKKDSYYKVASLAKLKDPSLQGNYVALHKNYCFFFAEGDIDLNANLGDFKIKTVGNVLHKLSDNQVTIETIMGMEFYFIDRLLKIISDKILENFLLDGINVSSVSFNKNLTNWVGNAAADKLREDFTLFSGFNKLPKDFETYSFLLSNVKLNWDTTATAYRSVGNIEIANIKNTVINKTVPAYLEIKKGSAGGDELSFFIQASDDTWFYFLYRGEYLFTVSSNDDYNAQIIGLKAKEKKKGDIEISIGNAENALAFKNSF